MICHWRGDQPPQAALCWILAHPGDTCKRKLVFGCTGWVGAFLSQLSIYKLIDFIALSSPLMVVCFIHVNYVFLSHDFVLQRIVCKIWHFSFVVFVTTESVHLHLFNLQQCFHGTEVNKPFLLQVRSCKQCLVWPKYCSSNWYMTLVQKYLLL